MYQVFLNFSIIGQLYDTPEDIELYPGGLSEEPTEPGKLGPTFSCIIGEQFRNLKFGDRFFFTHTNVQPSTKFCPSDLKLMQKRTLRDILCDNTGKLHICKTRA